MYKVYVLQSQDGKQYVGMTSDIERRLKDHLSGHTKTTSRMNGLRIVYTEDVETQEEALKREKYLKSAAGRRFRKNNIMPR